MDFPDDVDKLSDSAIGIQMSNDKKKKSPKRILHFSDGTLEEYSTDEEEMEPKIESIEIDPKTLNWKQWIGYWTKNAGKTALDTCDSVGESIAGILGITSPKYFYEIEEYNRMMKEDADEKIKVDEEMAGWSSPKNEKMNNQDIYKISTDCDLPFNQPSQLEQMNLHSTDLKY